MVLDILSVEYSVIQAVVVSVYDQMVCEVECFIVVIYQVLYTDIDLTIDPSTNAQLRINIMRCVCVQCTCLNPYRLVLSFCVCLIFKK